jgi:UDP-2-acetamido-2-deoxy-ribo-hexuluronate aminotransferase
MHQQTAFAALNYKEGDFPVAEKLSKNVFSLPMHPYMTTKDNQEIIKALA